MPKEMTAAGIEADTVTPTFKPRKALAAASSAVKIIDRIKDLIVISGIDLDAGISGASFDTAYYLSCKFLTNGRLYRCTGVDARLFIF